MNLGLSICVRWISIAKLSRLGRPELGPFRAYPNSSEGLLICIGPNWVHFSRLFCPCVHTGWMAVQVDSRSIHCVLVLPGLFKPLFQVALCSASLLVSARRYFRSMRIMTGLRYVSLNACESIVECRCRQIVVENAFATAGLNCASLR